MSVERNYEFKDENKLLYNIDNYDVNDGLAIDFVGGGATLRNINTNPKSQNFFGDGRLGSQTYIGEKDISPTCCYFQSLLINDELYGTHLQGVFAETGTFNVGDEIILHKRYCADKDLYDEIGKWDIVKVIEIIVDQDGINRYVLDKAPNNDYIGSETVNTATVVMQFDRLTLGDQMWLKPDMNGNDTRVTSTRNWRDDVVHPDLGDVWGGRMLGNPRGILYIKVRNAFTMLDGSSVFNHVGTWGGRCYNSGNWDLDESEVRHDYHVPGCGFLPSPSSGLSSNSDALPASNLCDFTGYKGGGGASFYAEGDMHSETLYASQQIPSEYKGQNGDLDKIFLGISGSFPRDNSTDWGFGGDGGGITIIQAKEMVLEQDAFITTGPVLRTNGSSTGYIGGMGAGGTTIIKCPSIVVNSDKAFISSTATAVDDTLAGMDAGEVAKYGVPNYGTSVLEFETINIQGTESTFQEVLDDFDSYRDSIFKDYKYVTELPVDVDEDGNEVQLITAETLFRDNMYPEVDIESTAVLAPTTSMAEYETDKYYKVYTKGLHNIDVSLWSGMNGFDAAIDTPVGTAMRVLMSRDNGDSWFKINVDDGTASAVDLADISTGNTIEELIEFQDVVALTGIFVANNDDKKIDLCIGMITDKSYKTPMIDSFMFNYSGIEIPGAPIRILPYHEEEFDREQVDFVWMQPLQRYGAMQNRLEISPTSNFEPTTDVLQIVDGDYSATEAKLHLPYVAKTVDNRYNSMVDLVLPYMMVKGVKPDSTYDEDKTSVEFDFENSKLVYHGDTFFVKGKAYSVSASEITVPDFLDAAPLRSDSADDGLVAAYKMSTNTDTADFADAKGVLNFEPHNVLLKDSSYVGDASYFDGTGYCSMQIANEDKRDHWLTKLHADRTIHFKLNPKIISGRRDIMNVRLKESSTEMFVLMMYDRYVYFNGASYDGSRDSYLEMDGILLGVEQNITITVGADNYCDVYLNGYKIIENVVYNTHPEYIDPEDDDESDDNADPIGVCLGTPYPDYTSYTFNGNIHEMCIYDYKMDAEQVMAISSTPNFHLRYDMRDEALKLLQFPYNRDSFMYENEMFGVVLNNPNRELSHLTPLMLAGMDNVGYESNNETLLLGKVYPQKYYKDSFRGVNATRHHIQGYNWFTNDWYGVSKMSQFSTNANNTIEQDYTDHQVVMVKPGRINKHTTITELEFVYSLAHFDDADKKASFIGVQYGTFSNSRSWDYEFTIEREASMLHWLKVHIGVVSYRFEIPSFEPGHRYTLAVVPVDGSFQDDVLVRIYSKTNKAFESNPIVFSSAKWYGYADTNRGFTEKDYSDLRRVVDNGDYVDVGCLLVSQNREFNVIGMTCLDTASVVTRENGYTDSYFIEKRLPAGLTFNIIRMDIISEIKSALTYVKSVISFDGGVTWKVYASTDGSWSTLADTEIDTIKDSGMTDADLYAVTDSVAIAGGFGEEEDTVLRTYLITDDNSITPSILSHKVLKNGPRIIDSWIEAGSYYRSEYEWHYLNDGSWNPYLEINTADDSDQNWNEFGTAIPSPTVFEDGHGSKPSTNLLKTYAHVKVDCLPKGKWYWRVSAYNGLKR